MSLNLILSMKHLCWKKKSITQTSVFCQLFKWQLTALTPSAGTSFTSLSDSTRTWSYSLSATRNMMEVTFSKQWIHFRLSDRCPPTSTILMKRRGVMRLKDHTLWEQFGNMHASEHWAVFLYQCSTRWTPD